MALRLSFLLARRHSGTLATMKTLHQAGPVGRVPVPAEELFVFRFERRSHRHANRRR